MKKSGQLSDSGCGGRIASTEPDEEVLCLLYEAAPPLVFVHEMRK